MQNKRREVGAKAKCQGGLLLAGTYRMECLDWILGKLRYNCPVPVESGELAFDPAAVVVISLYKENEKTLHFKAKFERYENLAELKRDGYPVSENPHAKIYAMFALEPVAASSVAKLAAFKMNGHVPVVARLEDFALTDEERAVLSHWAHNKGDTSAKPYEKLAKDILPSDLFTRMKASPSCGRDTARPQYLFPDLFKVPFPPPENPKFTFIDLFAGIGGIRLGYQPLGGKCVFSSEWDSNAAKTYLANFGEQPFGDITKIDPSSIPDFDLLLAGFPCQPFSIIGDKEGFNHETQGTLFFNIEKILLAKKPKAFMLENVRNLTAHDGGRTFKVILSHLRKAGYDVHYKVLNALDYGVPQKRERIIICGFRKKVDFEFPPPLPSDKRKTVADIIDRDAEKDKTLFVRAAIRESRLRRLKDKQFPRPYISHENVAGSITPHAYSCALRAGASANYILINDERRPSAREMLRIQGFPDEFKVVVNYTQIKHQTGNSVAVPVIRAVAERVIEKMQEQ